MNKLITLAFATLALAACNGQSNTLNDQQKVYKALDEMVARGMVATTEGGYTMTATLNGKPWKAQAIFPPAMSGQILGRYEESTIALPYWDQYKAGSKNNFSSPGRGVSFVAPGSDDLWSANVGEMEITKVTPDWMEGRFYFTATSKDDANKKIEVTNGFFRISTKKR